MCCLKYEEETYIELNKKLPNIGDIVITPSGVEAEVKHVNIIRQLVKTVIRVDNNVDIVEFKLDELKIKKKRGNKNDRLPKEEYLELKKLEKLEERESDKKLED
jgi:cell fate regulator YaaT (PSP1 superfamily)